MKKSLFIFLVVSISFGLFVCLELGGCEDEHNSKRSLVKENEGFHTITIKNNLMDFSVSKEITDEYDFYINSNYFTPERKPTCGVIINGKTENKQIKNVGGSFIVKNGRADIVFDLMNDVDYLSQTHIWLIKEGKINERVLNQNHAKKKFCRLLIGKNKNQDIVVIHSNKWNFITMRELTNFALNQGVTDAINLDSGPSIEVFLRDADYKYEMKSSPFKAPSKNPVIYITGKFK